MIFFKNDCTFHEHANFKVQKLPSQLRFSLPSIITTITSNEPWNTETHKTDRNPPITVKKRWLWTRLRTFVFPKSLSKMIDSSEKRKRRLAFELQSSRVFEKRSKDIVMECIKTPTLPPPSSNAMKLSLLSYSQNRCLLCYIPHQRVAFLDLKWLVPVSLFLTVLL